MFQTTWEIDRHVDQRTAQIAADRLAVSPVAAGLPPRSSRLRRSLGLALIAAGERLSDRGAATTGRLARPETSVRAGF